MLPQIIDTSARFSPCERYRYDLTRTFASGEGTCLWIMLNPSTATENVVDPTVRRCMGYTADWGFRVCQVANAFALRSTDPKGLRAVRDPVGPGNDVAITNACLTAHRVILGWGVHARYQERHLRVRQLIRDAIGFERVFALKWTKGAAPGHPLYLRRDAPLLPVPAEWTAA